MNPEQLKQSAEVMRRAANGEVVHYIQKESLITNQWRLAPTAFDFNWAHYEYRILDFPPPPEGQQWHNPSGLNATQVGVHEGWRLLLASERNIIPADMEFFYDEGWSNNFQIHVWCSIGRKTTFRTKSPLPMPKVDAPNDDSLIEKACDEHLKKTYEVLHGGRLPLHPFDRYMFTAGWSAAKQHFSKP